jgi:pSer/pThr/pTyr-binding forkhead associated (FHA) protein
MKELGYLAGAVMSIVERWEAGTSKGANVAALRGPDGQVLALQGAVVTIGRDASNGIVLAADKRVSRRHAEFRFRGDQWLLVDLDSRNGSKVNDRPVRSHPLVDGDVLAFGGSSFSFDAGPDVNATEVGSDPSPESLSLLSEREREVVALVAGGLTDRDIADRLFLSPSTVRSHLDRVGEKTGLRRRSELTRLAMELGLVD